MKQFILDVINEIFISVLKLDFVFQKCILVHIGFSLKQEKSLSIQNKNSLLS